MPKMFVDPPSGWKYGFPKEVKAYSAYGGIPMKMELWLVSQGYPQHEVDQWPDGVPYRCWYEEDE